MQNNLPKYYSWLKKTHKQVTHMKEFSFFFLFSGQEDDRKKERNNKQGEK